MKNLVVSIIVSLIPLLLSSQPKDCRDSLADVGIRHFYDLQIEKAKAAFQQAIECGNKEGVSFLTAWLTKCDEMQAQFSSFTKDKKNKNFFYGQFQLPDSGYARKGAMLSDNSFVIAGMSIGKKVNDDRGLFIKGLSTNGKILWQKKYDLPGRNDDIAAVRPTKDGSVIIAAVISEAYGPRRDIFLCKLDNKGNEVWQKRVDTGKDELLLTLNLLDDESMLISGVVTFDTGPAEGFIAKLTKDGGLLWSKSLIQHYNFRDMVPLASNRYLFSFADDFNYGTLNFLLTDENGKIIHVKKCDTCHVRKPNQLAVKSPGEALAVFLTPKRKTGILRIGLRSDSLVITPVCTIDHHDKNKWIIPVSVWYTSDNHLLVAGAENATWICRATIDGKKVWEINYGGYGATSVDDLLMTNNNSIVAIGYYQPVRGHDSSPGLPLVALFDENGMIRIN